jgi:hypothetical protein
VPDLAGSDTRAPAHAGSVHALLNCSVSRRSPGRHECRDMAKRVRLQGGRGRRIRAPKQSGAGFLILLRLRAKVWYPAVRTIRRVAGDWCAVISSPRGQKPSATSPLREYFNERETPTDRPASARRSDRIAAWVWSIDRGPDENLADHLPPWQREGEYPPKWGEGDCLRTSRSSKPRLHEESRPVDSCGQSGKTLKLM